MSPSAAVLAPMLLATMANCAYKMSYQPSHSHGLHREMSAAAHDTV